MKNKNQTIGIFIIASAIIWGATIIGCAFILKGTECYNKISLILGGATSIHLIFIMVPLALQFKKLKEQNK